MESIAVEGQKTSPSTIEREWRRKMNEMNTKREILKIWFLDAADNMKKRYNDFQTAQIYEEVAWTIDNIMSCTYEESREMYDELMQK